MVLEKERISIHASVIERYEKDNRSVYAIIKNGIASRVLSRG